MKSLLDKLTLCVQIGIILLLLGHVIIIYAGYQENMADLKFEKGESTQNDYYDAEELYYNLRLIASTIKIVGIVLIGVAATEIIRKEDYPANLRLGFLIILAIIIIEIGGIAFY